MLSIHGCLHALSFTRCFHAWSFTRCFHYTGIPCPLKRLYLLPAVSITRVFSLPHVTPVEQTWTVRVWQLCCCLFHRKLLALISTTAYSGLALPYVADQCWTASFQPSTVTVQYLVFFSTTPLSSTDKHATNKKQAGVNAYVHPCIWLSS